MTELNTDRRGVAAILEKLGVDPIMCCGHKEYALPPGRKTDPDFDMNAFRQQVRAIISGTAPRATLIPAVDTATNRPTLRRGATGPAVQELQTKLGLTADGSFGPGTEAAVRQFQRSHGLIPDGIVGPQTWAAISGSGTRGTGSTPVVPPIGVVAPMPIPPPDDPAHPVTVQGNKVIGPDGKSFAIVFKSGFVTSGKTPLADWLKAAPRPSDITESMVRVVRAVSLNEGKLEAINSYDDAFLSFGVLQWTAGTGNDAGELAAFLDLVRRTNADTFSAYFGRYGLGCSVAAAASTTGLLTINGSALHSASDKQQLRRAEWAYRFWRAGQDDAIRRCELVHVARRIDQFYQEAAAGHRIADWLTSELGVALVLDEHVNRPGHVPGTLTASIGKLPADTPAPAGWTTPQEEVLIQLYIDARNETNMTHPEERAARIAECVHEGTLSDQRGSFVTAAPATGV